MHTYIHTNAERGSSLSHRTGSKAGKRDWPACEHGCPLLEFGLKSPQALNCHENLPGEQQQ
eukprot:6469220-Pyramimonas_sp.AAC.1